MRAWALRVIARVRATAGDYRGSLQTALGIGEAGERAQALEEITHVQAKAGDYREALETARTIGDMYRRTHALVGVPTCRREPETTTERCNGPDHCETGGTRACDNGHRRSAGEEGERLGRRSGRRAEHRRRRAARLGAHPHRPGTRGSRRPPRDGPVSGGGLGRRPEDRRRIRPRLGAHRHRPIADGNSKATVNRSPRRLAPDTVLGDGAFTVLHANIHALLLPCAIHWNLDGINTHDNPRKIHSAAQKLECLKMTWQGDPG